MSDQNYSYYEALNSGDTTTDFDFFKPSIGDKPPTIMQVLPALNSGGVERGTIEISKALVSSGWKSVVLSNGGSMVKELTNSGGVHVNLDIGSKNPLNWPNNYLRLKEAVYQYDVSLIHARSRMPAWLSLNVAKSTDTPFMTTFHGRHNDTNLLKKFYNSVMTRGQRTIAISKYIASEITQRYPIHPKQLSIIPRGVDTEYFNRKTVSEERINKLKANWKIPENIPIVMLPGRVSRWKGHELLIESLANLKDQLFFCVIVGPFDGKEKFKSKIEYLIRAHSLCSKVRFVGDCSDMAAAYSLADIVISASLDPEPFGRTIIEAQAMGNIVLASNHGGAVESIIEGKTGWLFEPRNSAALSDSLKNALTLNEHKRSIISDNAQEHIKEKFSTQLMCMRTLSVYSEILNFKLIRKNN